MIDVNDLEAVGMGPECPKCGNPTDWLPCGYCSGEGYHELYEEDPFWYDEDDIETCDECRGLGGVWRCWDCKECFGPIQYPELYKEHKGEEFDENGNAVV